MLAVHFHCLKEIGSGFALDAKQEHVETVHGQRFNAFQMPLRGLEGIQQIYGTAITTRIAQGAGGSFQNKKPKGEKASDLTMEKLRKPLHGWRFWLQNPLLATAPANVESLSSKSALRMSVLTLLASKRASRRGVQFFGQPETSAWRGCLLQRRVTL